MRALEARYGPFTERLVWKHAQLVCEALRAQETTSREATVDVAKRAHGTGRRPARKDVGRALKRAGLQAGTAERLLVRLEALVKRPAGSILAVLGHEHTGGSR
jgi:hypothetical protein